MCDGEPLPVFIDDSNSDTQLIMNTVPGVPGCGIAEMEAWGICN
jgi:hypothetical protein